MPPQSRRIARRGKAVRRGPDLQSECAGRRPHRRRKYAVGRQVLDGPGRTRGASRAYVDGLDPPQRRPSTIAATIAAVARRPSPATTAVGWPPRSCLGRAANRGKLDRDPPRHARAQIVDRHRADPFRVKQRRLSGPRTDFRQLANLLRGEADGIVAPRAMAAGRVEAGQPPQMNGAGNPVGLARKTIFGGGKVLDHARYFRRTEPARQEVLAHALELVFRGQTLLDQPTMLFILRRWSSKWGL